jgi:hypothetical protein
VLNIVHKKSPFKICFLIFWSTVSVVALTLYLHVLLDGNDAGIFDIQRDEKNVGVLVLKERLDREKAGLYTLTIRYKLSLYYSFVLFKSYSPSGTNCPCIIHLHCKKG